MRAVRLADPADRVGAIDWPIVTSGLDAQGWAILPELLSEKECADIAGFYERAEGFRSHVVMAQHGFGRGEYRYFAFPLPPLVQDVRAALYPRLAPIANRWHERRGIDVRFPADHGAFTTAPTNGSAGQPSWV